MTTAGAFHGLRTRFFYLNHTLIHKKKIHVYIYLQAKSTTEVPKEKPPVEEKSETENWREEKPAAAEEEEDISTALQKEVAELKAESQKPGALRRFQVSHCPRLILRITHLFFCFLSAAKSALLFAIMYIICYFRSQVADTGVKSVVFIRTTLPDPLELVSTIIKTLDETKKQRTRFLMRLLPIEVVCKAQMNDIKLKADALFSKYFIQEPKTFSIVFK